LAAIKTLVTAIAEAFDLDVATVREQARVLRNAGWIDKQKPGRGGGEVTVRETVNLLLAVAGTGRPSLSCRPVEEHGSCQSEDEPWQLAALGMPSITSLPPDHSLADLLEALIEAALHAGKQPDRINGQPLYRSPGSGELSVEVLMHEPSVWSEVRIGVASRDEDGPSVRLHEERRIYRRLISSEGEIAPPFYARLPSDLSHQHRFTEQVLFRLAETLRRS
jgi:DNA-binding transcriptional ArsR family regulator